MSSGINRYKADLRDIKFWLFEQFHLEELLEKEPYAAWGREEVETVIDEVYSWACKELGPLNAVGDEQGCKFENGKVTTPEGFKKAWNALYEAGWRGLSVAEEFGGQAGPYSLQTISEEIMCGANTSFNMYPGLTHGVAEVVVEFGTPEQIKKYAHPLHNGKWAGTMCLTEPHAGSDVGANTTKATRLDDGTYKIEGTKIFISGGDQDLSANIIHLVLARTDDAPSGTKGLSLFMVPRDKLDGSGGNDVAVGNIEKKMGIKASSTCVLNFGENGGCTGELVGTEEQQGMKQMFHLMNFARIAVGVQGLSVASSAYLNALEYAKERKQGPSIKEWKNPEAEKVAIIEHPDVRRMLLDMKCRVEGIRALAIKLSMHADRHRVAAGKDDKAAAYHDGQVDLLVPLLKAYGSDQAFQVCATAIQTLGGAGFLKDHPIEQYCRDAKIFSIYEGTNHIQALDLVGRKLGYKGGANFQAFAKDIGKFVATNKEHPVLKAEVAELAKAMESLTGSAMRFLGWFQGGEMELVPLAANRFLEMMSETTVGWLLLDAAVTSLAAKEGLAADHPDQAFYDGKRYSAQFFARNVLPTVAAKAAMLGAADRSPMEIPTDAFATV